MTEDEINTAIKDEWADYRILADIAKNPHRLRKCFPQYFKKEPCDIMEIKRMSDLKIVDKSKEAYPQLEGAKYLECEGDLPEGVTIVFSNVSTVFRGEDKKGELVVHNPGSWSWNKGNSWHSHYDTPEAAIEGFNSVVEWN